jgi:hypothetical protein
MPASLDSSTTPNTGFPLIAAGELVTGVPDARTPPYWHEEAPLRERVLNKVLHGQHVPKVAELAIDAGVITIDAQHILSFNVFNLNAEAVHLATVAPNSSSDNIWPAVQLVLTNRVYDDLTARGNIIYNDDDANHLALAYDAKIKLLHNISSDLSGDL